MSGSVVELNSKVLARDERNKKQIRLEVTVQLSIMRQRIETLRDRKQNSRPTITHDSGLTPTFPNFPFLLSGQRHRNFSLISSAVLSKLWRER
jgi:hypothetical protein